MADKPAASLFSSKRDPHSKLLGKTMSKTTLFEMMGLKMMELKAMAISALVDSWLKPMEIS